MSGGESKKCGPHVELVANQAARITRCTCGTLHLQLNGNGITVRLPPDGIRHVANALSAAVRLMDLTDSGPGPADTIN
ncbi:MAG: hypothetical protein ACXVEF_11770 [Polyangiales bacterium]